MAVKLAPAIQNPCFKALVCLNGQLLDLNLSWIGLFCLNGQLLDLNPSSLMGFVLLSMVSFLFWIILYSAND